MATTVAELEVLVSADTSDAERGLQGLDKTTRNSGNSLKTLGAMFGLIGGGAVAGGFLSGAISAAMNFEDQMNRLQISTGMTDAELTAMDKTIKDLGADLPFSAQEFAALMYEFSTAGYAKDDLESLTSASGQLAAALGEDLAPTGNLVSSVLTNFGMSADDANVATDKLFKIIGAGKADMEYLTSAFENIGATAKMVGMSIEDTGTFLNMFAQAGINAHTAGRALAKLMKALANPTENVRKAMKALGITFEDASGQLLPVKDIILNIMDAWKSMTTAEKFDFAKLLVGEEFATDVMAVFEQGRETFEKFYAAYENAGSLQESIAAMMSTAKAKWDTFMETVNNLQLTIGQKLLPTFMTLVGYLGTVIEAYESLDPVFQNAILIAAGLTVGVLALGAAFYLASISLGALLSPIALVVVAIAALGAALYYAYSTNLLGFRDGVQWVWDKLTGFWNWLSGLDWASTFQALQNAWNTISSLAATLWPSIQNTISTVATTIKSAVQDNLIAAFDFLKTKWDELAPSATAAFNAIKDAISTVITTIQTFLQTHSETIKTVLSTAWSLITTAIGLHLQNILTTITVVWNTAKSLIEIAVSSITTIVSTAFNMVATIISTVMAVIHGEMSVWDGIKTIVSTVVDGIFTIVSTQFNAIKDTISTILNGVLSLVTGILNNIKSAFGTQFEAAKTAAVNAAQAILTSVVTKITQLWSAITEQMSSIKSAITTAFSNAKDSAVTAATDLASGVIGAVAGLYDATWSAGWNYGQGFIDGLSGIWDSIVSYYQSLIDKIKSIPGIGWIINSPSKLTTYYGEMFGEGLVVGMEHSMKDVVGMANTLTLAAVPSTPLPDYAYRYPTAQGQTVVHQTYNVTLSVREFEELTESVDFVQGLIHERTLYMPA